jgi:hypothetical protein
MLPLSGNMVYKSLISADKAHEKGRETIKGFAPHCLFTGPCEKASAQAKRLLIVNGYVELTSIIARRLVIAYGQNAAYGETSFASRVESQG